MGRDATGGDGEEDGFPDVGAEEGGGDVGVLEVEEGGGKGLEGGGGGCGEVDELWTCRWLAWMIRRRTGGCCVLVGL